MTPAFQPGGRPPAPPPLDLLQDFVNTEIPDWNRDDIASPDALAAFLRERGLLAAVETVDADTFVAARALRSALRELALANTLGRPLTAARQQAIDAVLGVFPLAASVSSAAPRLAAGGSADVRALGRLVAILVEAELAGTWPRMKACRQETCGWLFYDGSRNRSSSWCSMQICGSREKARAYRRNRVGAGRR